MQGWKLGQWGVGFHGDVPVQLDTVLLYSKLSHKAVTKTTPSAGQAQMSFDNKNRPVRRQRLLETPAAAAGPRDVQSAYAATHVTKRFSATQAGALKLARCFGDALVCVRYRHDPEGSYRYTTVELVVDEAPVVRRTDPDAKVMVHVAFDDTQLQKLVRAHGARWDNRQRLWAMPRRTAKKLGLLACIVKT
ncbi:MAG: hypothetical protein ABI671_20825 [Burkholderiales bacterium]